MDVWYPSGPFRVCNVFWKDGAWWWGGDAPDEQEMCGPIRAQPSHWMSPPPPPGSSNPTPSEERRHEGIETPEGHRKTCYYCGEECDALVGNPARWPIALCHRDEPGVVKWHHSGCVTDRLIENQLPSEERRKAIEEAAKVAEAWDRGRPLEIGGTIPVNIAAAIRLLLSPEK